MCPAIAVARPSDTPFFQTGEAKYGRPIIDRVITPSTNLANATKCVLVSFDSTMRSNLSVYCIGRQSVWGFTALTRGFLSTSPSERLFSHPRTDPFSERHEGCELFVAKKPSLARAIAEALPGPALRRDGYLECANGELVAWSAGHILELSPPDSYNPDYKKWRL